MSGELGQGQSWGGFRRRRAKVEGVQSVHADQLEHT